MTFIREIALAIIFAFIVNALIEEEIKNGIPAERIVSKDSSIIFIIFDISL
jgi:hypothetical protein